MGCCSTKEPNQKKKLYEDKSAPQKPLQQTPFKQDQNQKSNQYEDNQNGQQQQKIEENKTTLNTDNKNKTDGSNGLGKSEQNNQQQVNPTFVQSEYNKDVQNSQYKNESQNGKPSASQYGQQDSRVKENTDIIRKVNTITMNVKDIKEEDINAQLKKLEQENINPHSLKGASQTLSIQQMRLSKVDKQTVATDKDNIKQGKSQHSSTSDLQDDEPTTNMNNYQQQSTQNKIQKNNILNKHMNSIMMSLKTNEHVSKTCYSTPPVLYVDTDHSSKGEWMQIETFGVYGQASENNKETNFMFD